MDQLEDDLKMGLMNRTMFGIAALALASMAWADFDGPAPMAWRWAERTERRPVGTPIMQGDNIYLALGSRMYCLNRENGNLAWRFPVGLPLEANFTTGSVIIGNVMIAAADDGAIYGIDKDTGEMLWQYVADDKVFSMPVVAGDNIVYSTANNTLIAIDSKTGEPFWDEPFELSAGVYPSLAAWEDYVFYLTNDRKLNAINVNTKRPAWRSVDFGSLSTLSEMSVFGDTLYVTSGNYVSAIQVGTGRSRWSAILPGNLLYAPTASVNGVACVTEDGRLFFLNTRGQLVSRTGVDLRSMPSASPTFVGSDVVIPTANGMLNLIDPYTGEMKWNFRVPPMIKGLKSGSSTAGGAPGGPGGGRPGAGGGGLGGAPGAGGGGLGGAAPQDQNEMEVKYVSAAAAAAVYGDTLILLSKDGSVCAFDKNLGVDLTAPSARMAWPNAGGQVSGRVPLELVFIVDDEGSGVNYTVSSEDPEHGISIKINGEDYFASIDKEGRIRVKFVRGGTNKPLRNGRAEIAVRVSDGLGNTSTTNFVLTIDNTLPPHGGPKNPDTGSGNTGFGGGGPGFGGGGPGTGGGGF